MTTNTAPSPVDDLVGTVAARRTETRSGVAFLSYTFHVDPRCSQIATGDDLVEFGTTIRSSAFSCWECDYCVPERRAIATRLAGEADDARRSYSDGTGRRAAVRSTERTNRYAGKCADCSGWVEAEKGLLGGGPGAWFVKHRSGECVEVVAPAPVAAPVAPVASEPTPEGMHRLDDGRIFKVQIAHHGSGNPYAKLLVVHGHGDAEFVYAPGAIRSLSAATLMSLDEAREYGALYGVCVKCGATLTDEDSIRFGIGPVCGQRVAEWSTGTKLTGAQVRMLMSLPVPAIQRTARTANALVDLGLARIDGGNVVAV